MTDEFSGVPVDPLLDGMGPLKPEPTAVVLVALLAVVAALATALGRSRRKRFVAELARIAEDWERTGAGVALGEAAKRFLRPALAFLGDGAP